MSSVVRQTLGPAEWPLLVAATDRLFGAPELEPTLEAVVEVLLGYADAVAVSLADYRDIFRIAASGARDEERRRRLALTLHQDDAGQGLNGIVRQLRKGSSEFGRLHMAGAAPSALLDAVIERCAQALWNARCFERERHVALTFENAALSNELPRHECFNFSAIYIAGRSEALVGGDWYDAFPLTDGRMVVSIGDVEGSGLEAALAMVHVRQTIRALAEIQPDPSVMLAAANRALRAQHSDRHVTAFVGILDPATQRCTYANAGHPPPMVLDPDGRLERAGGRDFPIGVDAGQLLEIHDIAIPERSVMLLYTDGLTEATRDVLAGEARLEAVLAEIEPATCRNVAHAVCERMLSGRAVDDVAVLAITVGPLPTVRRWRFDPKYVELADRVRTALGEEMRQLGFDAVRAGDIETVLAELLANAVRHAPGTIELLSHCRSDALILHVLDRGPGFSPQFILPSDLFNERGRGLFLTRELSDDLVVERRAGSGSHIRVSFSNTKGEP